MSLIWHDHRVNEITDRWQAPANGGRFGGQYTHPSGTKTFPQAPQQLRVKYATRGADDTANSPGNKTFWQTRIADGAFPALGPNQSADPETGSTPAELHATGYVTPAQLPVNSQGNFPGFDSGAGGKFSAGLHPHRNPGRVMTGVMTNNNFTGDNPPANHLVRAAITSKVNNVIFGRSYGVHSNYWFPDAYDARNGQRLSPHSHDFNGYYRAFPGYAGPVSKYPDGYQAIAMPSQASRTAVGANWPLRLQGDDFWSFTASGRTAGPSNTWQAVTCFFRAPPLLNYTRYQATGDPNATVYPVQRSYNLYNLDGGTVGDWGWGPNPALGQDADHWVMLSQFDFFFSLSFRPGVSAGYIPNDGSKGKAHKQYIGSFIEWGTEFNGAETATGNGPSKGPGTSDPTLNGLPHFEYQFYYSRGSDFAHVDGLPDFQDVVRSVSGVSLQHLHEVLGDERGSESVEVYWEGEQSQFTSTPWPAATTGGVVPADLNYIPGSDSYASQVGATPTVWSEAYGIGTTGGAGSGSVAPPTLPPIDPGQGPFLPVASVELANGLNDNQTLMVGPFSLGKWLFAISSRTDLPAGFFTSLPPSNFTNWDVEHFDPNPANTNDRFLNSAVFDVQVDGSTFTLPANLSHYCYALGKIQDECSISVNWTAGSNPAGYWPTNPPPVGWTLAGQITAPLGGIQLLWHPLDNQTLAAPTEYSSALDTPLTVYHAERDTFADLVPEAPPSDTLTQLDKNIRAKAYEYANLTSEIKIKEGEIGSISIDLDSEFTEIIAECLNMEVAPTQNQTLIDTRAEYAQDLLAMDEKNQELTALEHQQLAALEELFALLDEIS